MNKSVIAIFLSVILLSLGFGSYVYLNSSAQDPSKVVQYIYKRYDPMKKQFNDLTGEIGFDGIDTLGMDQINNNKVRIKFGTMLFDLTPDDLKNEGLMKMLKTMGMTVTIIHDEETDKNKFEVKYKGEKVDEYDLQVGGAHIG